MKKNLFKKDIIYYIVMFFLLFLVHLTLFIKPILTADVLLNNSFYNGYAWEISLGRFGLYFIGLLKGFVSIPSVDLTISYILLLLITYFLIKLFRIENNISKIFIILLMVLSPIISATLLFHYCSVAYLLAFLCGILSIYFYYEGKNKWIRFLLPIGLIVVSLSMYQAYLSLIVTTFVLFQIKMLLDQKISFKQSGLYILILLLGMIVYFICMKLSLLVFHIDMASYSNANQVGFSTLLQFPKKIVESYQLFYQMYFTNQMMKNTYLGNTIFHGVIFILFLLSIGIQLFKKRISLLHKIILIVLVLLLPVFLNSVIFVIPDSKLQLLMSASYVVFFFYILSFDYSKFIKIAIYLCFIFLFRNYLIQDQATYLTLEDTYHNYYIVLSDVIKNYPNEPILVIGNYKNQHTDITNKNYGYISDDGLFWDEYHLRKLGVERFYKQAYGFDVVFGNETDYTELSNSINEEKVFEYNGNIVIDLNRCS